VSQTLRYLRMASIARGTVWLLLAASIVAVVAATTMPWSTYYAGHSHWPQVEWIPFSRRVRPLDFVLNVLLFVPFGWAATAVGRDASLTRPHSPTGPRRPLGGSLDTDASARRPYLVVGMACLLSLTVELFQVYSHGRMPTMTDVLANTLGAWVGTAIDRDRSR
jgi:glycopeptide antibiotics resistance protein